MAPPDSWFSGEPVRLEQGFDRFDGHSPSALHSGTMNRQTTNMLPRIAVTLDRKTVSDLDRLVREGKYSNRSRALQSAVDLLAERERRPCLARELAKLDPAEERWMAEEGIGIDSWPGF